MTNDTERRFVRRDKVLILPTGEVGEVVDPVGANHWAIDVEGRLVLEEDRNLNPAPVGDPAPDFGMSSAELAVEIAESVTRATTRILGVGQDKHDDGASQSFEETPVRELVEKALENLDDAISYAVMAQIRIRRSWDEVSG